MSLEITVSHGLCFDGKPPTKLSKIKIIPQVICLRDHQFYGKSVGCQRPFEFFPCRRSF